MPGDEHPDYVDGLFYVLHRPLETAATAGASSAVLMAAPLGDEMPPARRTLVELARALSAAGCWVLRFDYRGCGDSAGAFASLTLTGARDDLNRMADLLRRESGTEGRIDLVGVRFGGSLCLLAAEVLKPVRAVCAVSPIVQGRQEMRALLLKSKIRSAVTRAEGGSPDRKTHDLPDESLDEVVEIDGLGYRATFLDELAALDLHTQLGPAVAETLLMQVGPRKSVAPPLAELAERLGSRARAEAWYHPPFWGRIDHPGSADVIAPILAFLSSSPGSG